MGRPRLHPYKADLHIHTCLSPCGDREMRPGKIVEKSLERGLDIIAVCDHNSAENAGTLQRLGRKKGLVVFPGLEICTREEIHVLSIFAKPEQALSMQQHVYANLPGLNRADFFGEQLVVDENDRAAGENPRMLANATRLGIYEVVRRIRDLQGVSIASHIYRSAYGIVRQLGFIPGDLALDGLELAPGDAQKEACLNRPCVASSDAHFLDHIGSVWTTFILAAPTLAEIRLALQKKAGRRIAIA